MTLRTTPRPGALLFPQRATTLPHYETWTPRYLDYLFLAFTASFAFSPTDTVPLSRTAKMLMIVQAAISVVSLTGIAGIERPLNGRSPWRWHHEFVRPPLCLSLKATWMRDRYTPVLFRVGVLMKAIDAALELTGGLLILVLGPVEIHRAVFALTAHDLSTDPGDVVATAVRHAVSRLDLNAAVFAGIYLLLHGIVKLLLVAGLLRESRWVFPVALWFLGVFVAYQLYRYSHNGSLLLLGLSGIDLAVMWVVWREYRRRFGVRCANARR